MGSTQRIAISGIEIEVPTEPPSPEDCPVQSRIECSYGPESFTTALVRALLREDLGEIEPDQVVLRWVD